jgi:hypothetical protein
LEREEFDGDLKGCGYDDGEGLAFDSGPFQNLIYYERCEMLGKGWFLKRKI